MTDINLVERLAELKIIVKDLTAEAKQIEKQLIEEGAGTKLKTTHGTLSLSSRTTYECANKGLARAAMGDDLFMEVCIVPFGGVKKVAGQAMATALLKSEVFNVKSVSKFYTLRKAK